MTIPSEGLEVGLPLVGAVGVDLLSVGTLVRYTRVESELIPLVMVSKKALRGERLVVACQV